MNLLLINADQLRHDCVGYAGLRPVLTPNLDRLASEGVAYTRAFTPIPVCAPARQALLCGRHPDSFGAQWNYDFIPTPTVDPKWCWTQRLAERGYQNAYFGRFHVSADLKPDAFGYTKWVSWEAQKQMNREKYPGLYREGGVYSPESEALQTKWLGITSPVPLEDTSTHWMAARAAETIKEYAASGAPWHIWVDYEEPHLPCRPSEPFASMYDPAEIAPWDGFGDLFLDKPYCHRQQSVNWGLEHTGWEDLAPMVARYFATISQLDDAIGVILGALETSGQKDDTAVVFTSDHGDMCGSHQTLDKHYVMYDDITRVPLIARFPGASPRVSDAFVSNCLDVPASINEWFGLGVDSAAHGRPLPLKSRDEAGGREHIVSTSNGQQFGLYTTRMIRGDRYKYVWNLTDVDEFYDLKRDPGEKTNLINDAEAAGLVSEMRNKLHESLLRQGDRFAGNEWMRRQLLEGRKV
ncbi:MAG: sulfatase-like hydrolase/transferase [Defluviitaleaceae bacterium]|nr:sulfatase-like hydrolase/transferase [Defluviitaleaceae bacterium]